MKSSLNMLMLTMAVAAAESAITMQNDKSAFSSPDKEDRFSSSMKSAPVNAPVESANLSNPLSQSTGNVKRRNDGTSRPQKASAKTTTEGSGKENVPQKPQVMPSSGSESVGTSHPLKASTGTAVDNSDEKNVSQELQKVSPASVETAAKAQKASIKKKDERENEHSQSSPVTKQNSADRKSPMSQSITVDGDKASIKKKDEKKNERPQSSPVTKQNSADRKSPTSQSITVDEDKASIKKKDEKENEHSQSSPVTKQNSADRKSPTSQSTKSIDDLSDDMDLKQLLKDAGLDNIDGYNEVSDEGVVMKNRRGGKHPTDEAKQVFNGSGKSFASDEEEGDSKEPTSERMVIFNSEVKTKNGEVHLGAGGGELLGVEIEEEEEGEVDFADIQIDFQAKEEEDDEVEQKTNAKPRVNVSFGDGEEEVFPEDAFPDEQTNNLSKKDKQFFVPTRDSVTANKDFDDLSEDSLHDENEVTSTISIKSSKRSSTNVKDHQNQNRGSNKFSAELNGQVNKDMLSEDSLRDENDEKTVSAKFSERHSDKSDIDIENYSDRDRLGGEFTPGINDQMDDNDNDNKIDSETGQFNLDFSSVSIGQAQNFDDDFDLEGAFESIFEKRKKFSYSQMAKDWRNLNEELSGGDLSIYQRINRQLRNRLVSEKEGLGQEILLLLRTNQNDGLVVNMMQMMKNIGVFGERGGNVSDLPDAMEYVTERFNRMTNELHSITELFCTPGENKDGNENKDRGGEEEESLVISELVNHMKKEFEESRQQMSELENRNSLLSEELENKKSEISALQAQLSGNSMVSPKLSRKSEQVMMESEALFEEYQSQIQELRDKNSHLSQKLEERGRSEIQNLEAQKEEIEKLSLEKEKAEMKQIELQKALDEAQSSLRNYSRIETERYDVQAKLQEMEKQANLFQKHYYIKAQAFEVERNKLQSRIEEQMLKVSEVRHSMEGLQYQLDKATSRERLIRRDLTVSQNREKMANDKLNKSEIERAKLERQIESLQAKLKQAKAVVIPAENEVNSFTDTHKIEVAHWSYQPQQMTDTLNSSHFSQQMSKSERNQDELNRDMQWVSQSQSGVVSFSSADENTLKRIIRSNGAGYNSQRKVFILSQVDVDSKLQSKLARAAKTKQVLFSFGDSDITVVEK